VFATTSTFLVRNSNFIGDPTVSRRGLRFSYSTVTIENSNFTSFYMENKTGFMVGAGVYSLSSNTYISNCIF